MIMGNRRFRKMGRPNLQFVGTIYPATVSEKEASFKLNINQLGPSVLPRDLRGAYKISVKNNATNINCSGCESNKVDFRVK